MPAPAAPPLDRARSPVTGWTRDHWVHLLARMSYGFALAADRSGSPARVLYRDDRRGLPDSADGIESFARLGAAWGAWLANPANPETLDWNGRALNVADYLRQGLLDGTNPNNPYTYWGDIPDMDQRIVESADLAVMIWKSRARVFDTLSPAEQAQVMAWLALVDGKGTYPDNWILFSAVTQAVRLHMGFLADACELDGNLDYMAEFYRGDGWYVDGLSAEYELYNAWMFNWHYLHWAAIDGQRRPDYCAQVLARSRSFVGGFLHFFGSNGSYPAWGRSIVYRFAAVAAFQNSYQLGLAPAAPGALRRAASGNLKYFVERGMFDPQDEHIVQGYHGDFPAANEPYISPGSVYWCSHGLGALALDAADPFWTDVEQPLPVEQGDHDLALPAPGLLVSGRKATGQVLLLSAVSGQEHDPRGYNYTSKYAKLAYSTHFPFNLLPARGSYAPDAMLALTRDGRAYGHRQHPRAGGVAPGFMWTRFDEMIDDEFQPLWVGVVLWGDRQIRLSLLRPTFSVVALDAPGALGTDNPTRIKRRSDPAAGWEYAEVEGRAVAIKRLLGYDAQQPSAPFLDHSNINLAYAYAEQPLVTESQASVAPRALAAVSLVRPAPFDPATEFDGLMLTGDRNGHFTLALPGGEHLFVAVGDAHPRQVSVNGVAVAGRGLRYVRLTPTGAAGLGVTRIDGLASFTAPATFQLTALGAGCFEIVTDTGVTLDPRWLGAEAVKVSVRQLDGTLLDVTDAVTGTTLPAALVERCSAQLERTLVAFEVQV